MSDTIQTPPVAVATPPPAQPPSPFKSIMASVHAALGNQPDPVPATPVVPAPVAEKPATPAEPPKVQAKEPPKADPPKQETPTEAEESKRKRDTKGKFAPDEGSETPATETEQPVAKLRKAYEAAQAELKALKATSPAVPTEEYEALRKEVEQYKDLIHKYKREEHPEFKSKFTKPLEDSIQTAKRLVPAEYHARLENLLRQSQSPERLDALDNLLADMPGSRQAEILRIAGKTADIVTEREAELATAKDWVKNQESKTREQQRQEIARQQKYANELFESTIKDAAEEIEFFRPKEGDEKHNATVTRRVNAAKELFMGENTPERFAAAACLAVFGREAAPLIANAQKEITRLQNEIETLRSNRPGTASNTVPIKAKMTVKEAISAALKGDA